MKITLTPVTITVLFLTLSVISLLIMFWIWIGVYAKRTNRISRENPTYISQGIIDIKNKKVTIKGLSKIKKTDAQTYDLDDFIYMLSINPDSKHFRELLKLINNGNQPKKIFEKLKLVPHIFPLIIDYGGNSRSFAMVGINDCDGIQDNILFQIQNSPFKYKSKKINIEMDFLEDKISPITDNEIFSSLVKTSKKFLSKGATIIKISPKHKFVDSERDYLLNTIRINILRKELAKMNIQSHLGRDGSLYAISPNDRKKSFVSVQKSWLQRINTIFLKQKKAGYLNFDPNSYNIDTLIVNSRDSRSINEALIYVNLVSHNKRNDIEYDMNELISEAKVINEDAEDILKKLKEKKNPIRNLKYEIAERGIKSINEVYIDVPKEVIDPIIKFSFRHKKEILEILLSSGNKFANKEKTQITSVTIDMLHLLEIKKFIESEKLRDNLYIVINERKRVNQFLTQLNETAGLLKSNNIKTIQYITNESGGHIDIYRIFKSEFILIAKGLTDSTIISDNIKINIKNIENIKEKETKIINIK